MENNVLSAEYARQCFSYNAETGDLVWKRRPVEHFKSKWASDVWNVRFSHKKAGTTHPNGYLYVSINKKNYKNHRVVWLLTYGGWPKDEIDHINHNNADNRIYNLREVTHRTNNRNNSKSLNNKSGITGVCWYKQLGKWHAYINSDDGRKHLGYFDLINDAATAVATARRSNGYHENHGK